MSEILTNQVGPEKQFYDFLSDGKIKIQRNKITGKFFFHPRVAFPGTGERELEWVEISGKGIVHSSSCNRRLPEKGGDFNLSIIKLEEGPCMMSTVVGVEPDQVTIGTKVNARIDNSCEKPRVVFDVVKG